MLAFDIPPKHLQADHTFQLASQPLVETASKIPQVY